MMEMRFNVTVGQLSVEFEGSRDVYDQIAAPIVGLLMSKMSDTEPAVSSINAPPNRSRPLSLSVRAIAQKLSVSKGSDLLKAAAAYLVMVDGKSSFSRADLIRVMKQATGYFKTSFVSNLSNYLDTLSRESVLIEVSKDTYSLAAAEHTKLEGQLASG